MKRYAFALFLDADYKALEDWLNRQAERGWELERFRLGMWAVLVPRTHTEVTYNVDLTPPGREEEREEEYRQLCADAGWQLVGKAGSKRIYQSKQGRTAIPLQTDSELEEKQFRACVSHPALSAALRLVLLLFFLVGLNLLTYHRPVYWFELALHPLTLVVLGLMLLQLLWHLAMGLHAWRYGRAIRRAEEQGRPFPRPSVGRARLRGGLEGLSNLVLVVLLVLYVPFSFETSRQEVPLNQLDGTGLITAADFGYAGAPNDVVWLDGGPFLRSVSLIQSMGPDGVLYSERFSSRWPWLARQVFGELRGQERWDTHRKICCGSGESTILPITVPSAEEAILFQCERGQYLLLRKGNVVVRLMGDLDFTDERLLARIEAVISANEGV